MTLIASVWSPEGFAIAADGLQVSTNPLQRNERAQKIFSTAFGNHTGFAFGWAGAVDFQFASGRCLDFKEITQRVMSELPDDAYLDSPEDYFDRVALRIFCELPADVDISGFPEAEVIFVGYLAGRPLSVEISFSHAASTFVPPVVREPELSPGDFKVFAGSQTVLSRMQASALLPQPRSLTGAICSVGAYAQTCVKNSRTIPDCANLGGHVHIATVTIDGFSWVIAP